MKKSFFTLLFTFILIQLKAQIFTQRLSNESITITPKGLSSKFSNLTSTSNIALGEDALRNSNNLATCNVALGQMALYENIGNSGSTAVGHRAMRWANNLTSGSFTHNSAFGYFTLGGSTTPADNTGFYNTAIGSLAMTNNSSGSNNTAVGYYSLASNTTGSNNSVLGVNALRENTIGSSNIAIGQSAMSNNISTSNSIAIGHSAMLYANGNNVVANVYNVAVGNFALRGSSTPTNNIGTNNTAIGYSAIFENTSGSFNVSIGNKSLENNTSGDNNTSIGNESLNTNSTGSNNTVLGYQAGFSNISGSRNVFLGYKAGYNADTDDILVIENSDANRALIRGDFANDKIGINRLKADLDATNFTFQVNGDASKNTAGNWSSHSDRRLKKNISYLNSQEVLKKVLSLKGVTYEWNDTKTGTKRPEGLQYGFIAQELKEVFPSKIQEDKNGYLMTAYGDYDPMIVESIKALKELIDEQRKLIISQQNEINELKGIVSSNKKEVLRNTDK